VFTEKRREEKRREEKRSNVVFLIVGILTLFLYRGLSFYDDILDPDEAHILTPAINFLSDRNLWAAGDSTTLGPVCWLPVVFTVDILHLFGYDCRVTFFLARLLATLMVIIAFLFVYKICRNNLSTKLTRVVLLFYILFFSFCYDAGLMSYNSELVYLPFISLIIYLIDRQKSVSSVPILILIGSLCGLLQFIKLQTIPMAAVCMAWIFFILWKYLKNTEKTDWKKIFIWKSFLLIAGFFIPTGIIIFHLLTFEKGISTAWLFYIENARAHVLPMFELNYLNKLIYVCKYFIIQNWYNTVFVLIVLSVVLYCFNGIKLSAVRIFSALLLLSSLFALVRTVSPFNHYVIFASVPALLFFIQCLKNNKLFLNNNLMPTILTNGIVVLWICIFSGFYGNVKTQVKTLAQDGLITESPHYKQVANVTQYILQHTSQDDFIVIWGWAAKINIYTNRKSATAQSDSYRLYNPFPAENITKYISDIKRNKPKLIIDAVTQNIWWLGRIYNYLAENELCSLESHEEIWNSIKDDYSQTDILPIGGGGKVKIYTRRVIQ
jgi:hypothetical protein